MTNSAPVRRGLILLAAAGLFDALQLILGLAFDDNAPVGVLVLTALFGALTLAGVAAARRGSRAGLITAVVVRVLDFVVLGLPGFFLDAPWYALAIVVVCLVLSVAGIWSAAPALRRATARTA